MHYPSLSLASYVDLRVVQGLVSEHPCSFLSSVPLSFSCYIEIHYARFLDK